MARERVQVQGIGGAVPGISPTIQRGGQYSVQVQQAGRNKLMDLADALGQVNPLLRQYAGVAEQEAEMFEEELARKSPEEVQAMLKKTEGELDKQVRRGGLGWLMSPLNQKRKLRAVGKLASRDLVSEIQNRLVNPKQGDPEDLNERADFVRQEFINSTPALQSLITQEGLNEASRAAIKGVVSGATLQEAAQAKEETLYATGSTMYDKIFNQSKVFSEKLADGDYFFEVDSYEDAQGNRVSITFADALMEEWNETGAYTAKEQRALLSSVLNRLSSDDMELEAEGLLKWAKGNLKFGNAAMSDMEYNKLSSLIDKGAELAEERRDKENFEFVKDVSGNHTVKLTELEINGEVEYNGEVYTDKIALDTAFKQQVIDNQNLSNEDKGKLIKSIADNTEGMFRTARTETKNQIYRAAPTASAKGLMEEFEVILNFMDEIPSDYKIKPEIRNIVRAAYDEAKADVDGKMDTEWMSLGIKGGGEAAERYARDLVSKVTPKIQAKLREAYDSLQASEEKKRTGLPLGTKPTEKIEVPKPEEDPEDLLQQLPQWQSFITDDPKDKNSNTAKKYLQEYRPRVANEAARLSATSKRKWFLGAITQEEALQVHFRASAKLDNVYSLEVISNVDEKGYATNYAGKRFKPKELIGDANIDTFVILTQDQLDKAETEEGLEIIKRAKEAAGITIDVYEFIRRQKKLRKNNVIVNYTPMPDIYKPLRIENELQELIDAPSDFDPFPDFLLID